ncbi:polycomb group protein FIE2-like isoform X1 [Henckelia pumila]|uniref:polycomb group protein FIE2-like isoform X1 n=1 Tax=Henckelia pumila TaxID=405737 RepID=UPI003C6E0545
MDHLFLPARCLVFCFLQCARHLHCCLESFVGHGDSLNEIRTQPLKPSLVVSASKDESVWLWNIHTGICILIFSGAGRHRNEVLSVVTIVVVAVLGGLPLAVTLTCVGFQLVKLWDQQLPFAVIRQEL